MKAKIDYTLETNIRIERKRQAARQCKSWTMYFDTITGEYFNYPNLTPRQIKDTRLPGNNRSGQETIVVNL